MGGGLCLSVHPSFFRATHMAGILRNEVPMIRPERPKLRPPSSLTILKWKSNENIEDGLKYRDVITFCGVAFKKWAQLIGRALQVLVNHVPTKIDTMALPNMLGVRDMVFVGRRLSPLCRNASFREMDIDDMFWNLDKEEVVEAIEGSIGIMLRGKRETNLWFSIHKSGERSLDRLGKSSCEDFFCFESTAVVKYVKWDLFNNTLFCVGPLVMAQGKRGVPIGGFISAQCAELWCIYREHLTLTRNAVEVTKKWGRRVADSPFHTREVGGGYLRCHPLPPTSHAL